MKSPKQLALLALTAALLPHLSAQAQSVNTNWRVVAADNAAVTLPGLPAGWRSYSNMVISDTQGDHIGVRMTVPTASAGYWARRPNGSWGRFAAIGVTGAAGPGRTGSESGHVFVELGSGGTGAGPDGQRLLLGRAGVAGAATTQNRGLWRWTGSGNVEIARSLTDGALGPGLGAGWVFPNSSTAFSGRSLNSGQALISADVISPTQATRLMVARHVPGQGNKPCILRGSTDPALSPGLAPGDNFNSSWNMSNLAVTPQGRVFGRLDASGVRYGIWELCNGAPRALVVNDEAGVRGPQMGNNTAVFSGSSSALGMPRLGTEGTFFFFANFRMSPSESNRAGLFWHDGQVNRPLVNNVGGPSFGPGWMNTTWNYFDESVMTASGSWAAFSARVNAADGGTPRGLWRVTPGRSPELMALIGLTGAYGPEPNRTWNTFLARGILPNGDVIQLARTSPGDETGLWLLRGNGVPARRLLKVGDRINVPTSAGLVQDRIESISTPSETVAHYSGGGDYWVSADGSVLLTVTLSNLGRAYLMTRVPVEGANQLFADGFE